MQKATDATKSASRQFQIFVKPTGAVCNLGCDYCYYLTKKNLYPNAESFRMSEQMLEAYIVQHIDASPGPEINFSWHGGEPTLLGLEYFQNIVAMQKRYRPSGFTITNNMQTNGVLLDEQWCRFLKQEGFSVGLSLDGPEELHDTYRHDASGRSVYKEVMKGYGLLRRFRVPCDILCVVNAENVKHATRVYRFFKGIGALYIGFIPLVEMEPRGAEPVSSRSVTSEAWGDFLCTVYDEWLSRDIGKVQVQIFEEVARTALGHPHALCVFRDRCGDVPAVEHNGDFFSCDHFVDAEHRIGNISERSIAELLEDPAQRAFGKAKSDALPHYCRSCDVLEMCHGACPKDRIIKTPDGEPGLNYLCAGYRKFFTHCKPFVEQLVVQSRGGHDGGAHGKPGAGVAGPAPVQAVADAKGGTRPKVGRNDPCPCGSGKKYKHCCLS